MFYSNYTVSVKKFPIGAMFTIRFHETIKKYIYRKPQICQRIHHEYLWKELS